MNPTLNSFRHADGTEYEQKLQDEIDLDEKISKKQMELKKIEQSLEKEKRDLEWTREKRKESDGKLEKTRAQMRKMAAGVERLTGKRVKREEEAEDEEGIKKQIEIKRKVSMGGKVSERSLFCCDIDRVN